jgi:rod shape-determining protein MreC
MSQFFLKYRKIFFLSALLLLSLTLYATRVEKKKEYNLFDRFVLTAFSPPLRVTSLFFVKTNLLWKKYLFLINLEEENALLKEQVKKLELESQFLNTRTAENKRLRELLSFKKKYSYKIIPAEIIGRDPSSWFKTIMIDKGADSGITPGSGVVTPAGVVGRVINVSENTSKILLTIDVNSSFDALVKRTRARGVVEGGVENLCKLSYVLKTEDIRIGDTIVSSGLHKQIPEGVTFGEVLNITKDKKGFFQDIEIKPSVDFSKLNEVLIAIEKQE